MTLRLNASGEIISRSINPNNITDQLTAADLPAYTIFGAAKFISENSGISYYDPSTGQNIGFSYSNNNTDGSVDTTYVDVAEQFLGSYWSDGMNSRFESQTTEDVTFDFDYDATTADTTLRVRVQRMEESWTRGNQTETGNRRAVL